MLAQYLETGEMRLVNAECASDPKQVATLIGHMPLEMRRQTLLDLLELEKKQHAEAIAKLPPAPLPPWEK